MDCFLLFEVIDVVVPGRYVVSGMQWIFSQLRGRILPGNEKAFLFPEIKKCKPYFLRRGSHKTDFDVAHILGCICKSLLGLTLNFVAENVFPHLFTQTLVCISDRWWALRFRPLVNTWWSWCALPILGIHFPQFLHFFPTLHVHFSALVWIYHACGILRSFFTFPTLCYTFNPCSNVVDLECRELGLIRLQENVITLGLPTDFNFCNLHGKLCKVGKVSKIVPIVFVKLETGRCSEKLGEFSGLHNVGIAWAFVEKLLSTYLTKLIVQVETLLPNLISTRN